jgi:hypothetical protein
MHRNTVVQILLDGRLIQKPPHVIGGDEIDESISRQLFYHWLAIKEPKKLACQRKEPLLWRLQQR